MRRAGLKVVEKNFLGTDVKVCVHVAQGSEIDGLFRPRRKAVRRFDRRRHIRAQVERVGGERPGGFRPRAAPSEPDFAACINGVEDDVGFF